MVGSKKKSLSISQLDMLSRCGEQYYQRYIKNRKIPPGISLVIGRVDDRSVGKNLTKKMETKSLHNLDEVADFTADIFNEEWEATEVLLTPEESDLGPKVVKGQAMDKSIRLAVLHASELAPFIEPTHIQRKVEVELPGFDYDLIGYIDIQEGSNSIRDTKTSGKTPTADIADKSDQLTIYAMMTRVMDGVIPSQLCLDYLVDLKTPKATTFSTTRTEADFNPMLRRIEAASKALQAGIFIPARETDWWCNPRWCGYHATCPYVKQSRRPSK
jgi:RecB family exonuclease